MTQHEITAVLNDSKYGTSLKIRCEHVGVAYVFDEEVQSVERDFVGLPIEVIFRTGHVLTRKANHENHRGSNWIRRESGEVVNGVERI